MAVEMNEFRVFGVNKDTGKDVSVVIEAATKAAAEVKADQQNIDTTHIVRMKAPEDALPDGQMPFIPSAADTHSTTPTDKLIEEVVPPESPREIPEPPPLQAAGPGQPPAATPGPSDEPTFIVPTSRPAYNAPTLVGHGHKPSGMGALMFVCAVLCGIAAGGYYVLVQEPRAADADAARLYSEPLFDNGSEVLDTDPQSATPLNHHNASGEPGTRPPADTGNTQAQAPAHGATPHQASASNDPAGSQPLVLQSVVTSPEGRFAVINNNTYPEGAEIAGCTLLNVADDWVLMQSGGEQFVLRIMSDAGLRDE